MTPVGWLPPEGWTADELQLVAYDVGDKHVSYALRSYRGEPDAAPVFGPWCKQINSQEPFRKMSRQQFRDYKRETIEQMVKQFPPIIACNRDDPESIYGWCCGGIDEQGQRVLHFAYIKEVFRRHGIARRLLQVCFPGFGKRELLYTHETRMMPRLVKSWHARPLRGAFGVGHVRRPVGTAVSAGAETTAT